MFNLRSRPELQQFQWIQRTPANHSCTGHPCQNHNQDPKPVVKKTQDSVNTIQVKKRKSLLTDENFN